jgi:predicted  nucleic acid-binding Zn-ribbon protein
MSPNSLASNGARRTTTPAPTTIEGLRREIEHTRAELGETVEALAAKADVKKRLQESAEDAKNRVRERAHGVVQRAEAALPDGAQHAAKLTAETARRYRTQLLLAGGAGLLIALVIRWQRRRTP